jgi:hypothetical protein
MPSLNGSGNGGPTTVNTGLRELLVNQPSAPPPEFPWVGTVGKDPSILRRILGTRTYHRVKSGYGWLRHEKKDHTDIPLGRKLRMWRRGFFAESAVLYDLPRNDPGDYVSDYTRAARCAEINSHNEFFTHKMVLRSFLLAMGFRQAETVALLFEGRILSHPFGGDTRQIEPEELKHQLETSARSYIVKPEAGAGGEDLFLLEQRDGQLVRRRGAETVAFDLGGMLRESSIGAGRGRMTLIEERVEQGSFWQRLFPDSANTIRLLTLWIPGEAAPIIARAVQCIGTADSVPTDNWSAGGISVPIDLGTGMLGRGRLRPSRSNGQVAGEFLSHHPDSGTEFAGAALPGWDQVKETVLRAAASVPFNLIAGWDVLVALDGVPIILEADGDCDIDVLQVHGGLLADPTVRRFYQELGAVA